MSESGPWGSRDGRTLPPVAAPRSAEVEPDRRPVQVEDKRQNPVWAVISTLLLGGLIWWFSGSLIVAASAIFGLFVHEYGHVLAMNRLGMGPARIYIIPFLGGLAKGQRNPRNEWDGVLVALAGPAFGLLAMIPLVGLWMATGEAEWMIGAFLVAMINLINLAPAPPLDGSKALGPVLARVDPMLEKIALIAIGALVVWWGVTTGRFILAVFLGIALLGHLRAGAWRPPGGKLTWPQAGQSLGLFLATGLACAAAGIGVLLPLADGSLPGAIDFGARFIGIER